MLLPLRESTVPVPQFRNRLLSRFTPEDLEPFGRIAVEVLPLHLSLETPGAEIEHVFFIEEGFASVVAEEPGRAAVEVGVIGPEGMTGAAVILGGSVTPFHTYMQNAGRGVRLSAAVLRSVLRRNPPLRDLLNRYSLAYSIQVATTAAANGSGLLEERVARWLLMVSDRVGAQFRVTHQFLALMLAATRPGVTLALQSLEGKGLIQSLRGTIIIIDRPGLVALTEGIYGTAEREYERLLA